MQFVISSARRFSPVSFGALFTVIANRASLARQRRALGKLDAHLLNDIGISAEQARLEAQKSLWDAPENWRA